MDASSVGRMLLQGQEHEFLAMVLSPWRQRTEGDYGFGAAMERVRDTKGKCGAILLGLTHGGQGKCGAVEREMRWTA